MPYPDPLQRSQLEIQAGEALAVYRLPGDEVIRIEAGPVRDFDESRSGFLVACFDRQKSWQQIEPRIRFSLLPSQLSLPELPLTTLAHDFQASRKDYEQLVAKGLAAISQNQLQKVVLARMVDVRLRESFSPEEYYLKLAENYPSAFVYLLYTPEHGCWLGATPEVLLHHESGKLKTMALAGTAPQGTEGSLDDLFTAKERHEQQLVTDAIRHGLEQYASKVVAGPQMVTQAGKLRHIVSQIEAEVMPVNLRQVLYALHPTPAVGGLPRDAALDFIRREEGFDRRLYCGFIGPWQPSQAQLFVNLRCMQLNEGLARQYAGAGIVAGSVPEKEWLETEAKLQTLARWF